MSTTNNIYRKLSEIQVKLKATKDLYNSFGRYSYRSAESILEAMKPLLDEYKVALVINDDIVMICSDGISDEVLDTEFKEIILEQVGLR